ncbi:MAG: caspase family protein [Prevotella sp.]|nr:caspase family protein [Prevotella sp.]
MKKEDIYLAAYRLNTTYKDILDVSPRLSENYTKAKTALRELFGFLTNGAAFYSQRKDAKSAFAFAEEAVNLAMTKEMQDKGLRNEKAYAGIVYFAATYTYNSENFEQAVKYLQEYVDVTDAAKHSRVKPFLEQAKQQLSAHEKNRLPKDVNQGVPDFDTFAKETLARQLNEWGKKSPFETVDEYKQRVSDENVSQKRRELQQALTDEYVERFACQMTVADMDIKPYDAEHESFLIVSPYGNIILPVPRSRNQALSFSEQWNNVQLYNPQFVVTDNRLALASLTFSTPAGRQYVYDNRQNLAYNEISVDVHFDVADIGNNSNGNDVRTNPKIGKIEVVAGKSDVDTDIPKSRANNANTYAVIIANERYRKVSPVPMAGNDGRVFAQYCEKTLNLPCENVMFYENATFADMIDAVSQLKVIASLHSDLKVIFYYAGHGIPNESSHDAFLLPVDADGRQTKVCYPVKELYSELGALRASSVVVFLDACFSGATGDGGTLFADARSVFITTKEERPAGNMVVFSATTGDQTAYPYKEREHGLFTYYLLKRLQETKGKTTLGELSQYLIKNVQEKSLLLNKKLQTPTVAFSASMAGGWKNMKLR